MRYEPWDVSNQPDRANIERIVAYLGQLREGGFGLVPTDALDAIVGLLARAEVAEGNLEQLRAARTQGGQRQAVEEISYVCRVCGAVVVKEQVVGAFRPSVCGAERCRREARQADARERQRRFRQQHAAGKGERPTDKQGRHAE
jgi:hypothetical protein